MLEDIDQETPVPRWFFGHPVPKVGPMGVCPNKATPCLIPSRYCK